MTIKHILFPFDFSKPALLAAQAISVLAKQVGARVTVLSIIPLESETPLMGMPTLIAAKSAEMRLDLESRLAGALKEELVGLSIERLTDCGDPAVKITEYAHSRAVDLIMMPTHGCGLFRRLLIGSVTAKVLHDSHCPVWTAAHVEEQPPRGLPKRILCAVDETRQTLAVVQWAAEFGSKVGATVKLIYVVPPISAWLTLPTATEIQRQMNEDARVKICSMQRSVGLELPLIVAEGEIADTIAQFGAREGAELVIIGRGSLHTGLGRIRTHSYGIVQKSSCPVLSV